MVVEIPEHLAHLPVVPLPDVAPQLPSGGPVTDQVIVMPGKGSIDWWYDSDTGETTVVATGVYAHLGAT